MSVVVAEFLGEEKKAYLRYLLKLSAGIGLVLFVLFFIFNQYYEVRFNTTVSLPSRLFLVEKGVIPSKKGEYISFFQPKNRFYDDKNFIKIVGGVAGDVVTFENGTFHVNGKDLGIKPKSFSKNGKILTPGPTGTIPEGYYFVYTKHIDGYDSRYKDIGWIDEARVTGRAYPVY